MVSPIPHEVSFGWIYFPPLLFAIVFGILVAWIVSGLLNRTGLSRFFWRPPIAFLAFLIIAASLFALLIMAP
jgi:hypothetical protein